MERPGFALGVRDAAEEVELPARRDGNAVRLGRVGVVEAADGALRCEVERRQVGQARRAQRGFGLGHAQVRRPQVGVVLQRPGDQVSEAGIGEDFAPRQVAHGQRVGGLDRAVEAVGRHRVGPRVGLIDAAGRHQKGRGADYQCFFHR